MKERILIVFIAGILGLLITTAGFFIYQSTKVLPIEQPKSKINIPLTLTSPTPKQLVALTIFEPKEEAIVTNRSVAIKGKTDPKNTVIISSNQEDIVATPSKTGEFSATITIDAGINKIITEVVTPEGKSFQDERMVTYTAEDF